MTFGILQNYHRDKVDDVDNASKAKSPKYKAKPVRKMPARLPPPENSGDADFCRCSNMEFTA